MRIQKLLLLITVVLIVNVMNWQKSVSADTTAPSLTITQTITEEPLLGGQVRYQLNFANQGTTPITDKGYNLTITDTLPIGVAYLSADPAPMIIKPQSDGTTQLVWDNIADLEVNETLKIELVGLLNPSLIPPTSFANQVNAAFNRVPDNSGSYVTATNTVISPLQTIDIEAKARQSTADEQATGAGEYDGSADWPYQYQVTVKNNNVGSTKNVQAFVTLPPGVAYKGNPAISPNPNNIALNPTLALQEDGSLQLSWSLGDLTTAQYNTPILITFDTAIPYRYRTGADSSAESGAFVGPMSGEIIAEDCRDACRIRSNRNLQQLEGERWLTIDSRR